jgi:Glycosyl transferase family 2
MAGTQSLGANVVAIIPCLDAEQAILGVIAAVLAQGVSAVIAVDGGSQDRTVECARTAGARVVVEPERVAAECERQAEDVKDPHKTDLTQLGEAMA